jgi:hypothetical protein
MCQETFFFFFLFILYHHHITPIYIYIQKMKSIFAAVAAFVAVVSAQANVVSITSPLSGTVYTAGQPAIITW